MTDSVLFFIGDLVMLSAIIGTVVFAVSYATFFAWRRTPAGRSLMYFVLALVAWSVQSFVSRLNPDYPGRGIIRILVYLLITVTVWRLVVTLWRSWGRPLAITPRKEKQ